MSIFTVTESSSPACRKIVSFQGN